LDSFQIGPVSICMAKKTPHGHVRPLKLVFNAWPHVQTLPDVLPCIIFFSHAAFLLSESLWTTTNWFVEAFWVRFHAWSFVLVLFGVTSSIPHDFSLVWLLGFILSLSSSFSTTVCYFYNLY